jgi:hypothetical protein
MRESQRKPVPKAQARESADLSELITPEYIPAEVFLENMGFFTPSSRRVAPQLTVVPTPLLDEAFERL